MQEHTSRQKSRSTRKPRGTRSPDSTRRPRPAKESRIEKKSSSSTERAQGISDLPPLRDPHHQADVFRGRYGLEGNGNQVLRFYGDQWWTYDGRRYTLLPPGELRARVTLSIQRSFESSKASASDDKGKPRRRPGVTRSLVSDTIQALGSLQLVPGSVEQPAWLGAKAARPRAGYIAMENGLVDVEAVVAGKVNVVRPHSADWFSPTCLTYAYDPAATCPMWLTFLGNALEDDVDRIALIQEWFGYCLTHDTALQKFLVIVGEGADGKTVLVLVLIGLLGTENVSHVPLELFGQRFQLTTTLGKLANAVTEIGDLDRAAEGLLKAFVSGDPMFFDRKNLPGVNARPTARLLFTTNNLPQLRDRSSGIWRRMILMPFRVSVPEHRQDKDLAQRLESELPGIFNWAIEGLKRLRQRGRFTEAAICREALDSYRTESNPARAFLEEYVAAAPGHHIHCKELRSIYRGWCEDRGYKPLNDAQFGRELNRAFRGVDRKKVPLPADPGTPAHREWAYVGVRLA